MSSEPKDKNDPERIACEDCGDEVPKGKQRRRCKHCGLLVCGWCYHHVHSGRPA